MLAPFEARRLIELEFVFQIFTHARHDQRVRIAGDDLCEPPHTRAAPGVARQQRRISRYSMIASDSNRIGPSPSIKAGSAIIGLTARYAASRCAPFMRFTSTTSSGTRPLRLSAMRTR